MNFITTRVRQLYRDGVSIREIAELFSLSPSTTFRVIHGKELPKQNRCPHCGALLSNKICFKCRLIARLRKKGALIRDVWSCLETWDGKPVRIELQLRPAEYARYLVVRGKKEEEMESMYSSNS